MDRYLEMGLIEISHANCCSRPIIVKKSSGRHQIAVALNELNEATILDCYPLPRIIDNLDSLSGAKYLTSIDICGAYHSIPVAESSRNYFTFITPFGLFRWKRLPYGWRNAGTHFCFYLDRLLADLKYCIMCSYSDDLIVYGGDTFEEHLKCVNLVFNRLQEGGLRIKKSLCDWQNAASNKVVASTEIEGQFVEPLLQLIELRSQ